MLEGDYPSEYSSWQDDNLATAQSVPYIDTSAQTDSPPSTPPLILQPEQPVIDLARPEQIATLYQLGKIQKELKHDVSTGMTIGIISCMLGILCFIPLILLVLNIGYFGGLFWTAFLGFGSFAYGINRITYSLNSIGAKVFTSNLCYYLCSQGIMLIKGKKVQAIRWDQVKSIQKIPSASYPGIPWEYILYPFDGSEPLVLQKICITIKAIRRQIEHEITQRLLPTSITAYKASQTLNFGPLDITPQGLHHPNAQVPLLWEKLGSINESGGFLNIREKGTLSLWATIEISAMLNLCVLWPLLEEIKRNQFAKENLPQNTLINQTIAYTPPSQQSEWQEYE